ncbi:glutathionylspermidine synthase family protein [Muricoccus radiodurans]|uniref:glutathionylspermidine synthase family protein n=1 Tax=Muricoccus radiodurans TaxID=2231721 RepID=UPI003CE87CBA
MQRHTTEPRPDRRERARALGFAFADIEGEPYWDETAYYSFTAEEVDVLEAATDEIERLTIEAVDTAIRQDAREAFGLSPGAWRLAKQSWERQERHLYGRLDLRWDGSGPPLLLEYNADTPTALFEAGVVQWEWLTCTDDTADQFNSIHEALIESWGKMGLPGLVHFACARDSTEDRGTVDYLRDTAMQAGLRAEFLYMDEIGWDGTRFRDLEERPISALFKLYPWEWLLAESFGSHIATADTRWIEPAWRMIPAGKGFLAWLWKLFPGHPNLLPAFLEPGRTGGREISKPFWGREGSNLVAPDGTTTDGPYAGNPRVWQAWAELPRFDGGYPVLGSWIIGGRSRGLGIREDSTPLTRDTSRFVPHLFRPAT